MNSDSTEPEVVSDGLENGSKRGNCSGLAIDAGGAGGSKQARTSGDTVSGIKEEDSIESSSGNYSGLAIDSGVSKKEQNLATSEIASCTFHVFEIFSQPLLTSFLTVTLQSNKPKKRSYGRNKSLSRKKYRGTAKTVSANAVKASFCRPRTTQPYTSSLGKSSELKMKSLRNQKAYIEHKNCVATQKISNLQSKITALQEEKKLFQHTDKQRSMEIAKLEAQAVKAEQTLEARTARWMSWRDKVQEDICKIKKAAERRVAALEKKYSTNLSLEQPLRYKMERNHVKSMVVLQNTMDSVRREAE